MELAVAEDVWPSVMSRIHTAVGTDTFQDIFERLKLDALDGATARMSVPSAFLKYWISANYRDTILDCVKAEVPYVRRVKICKRDAVLRYVVAPPVALISGPPPIEYHEPVQHDAHMRLYRVRAFSGTDLIGRIKRQCAAHWGVKYSELASPVRRLTIVRARQIAMFAIKTIRPDCSLPRIGKFFGGKDHTTVLHAVRVITRLRQSDPFIGACIEDIFRSTGFSDIDTELEAA